MFVKFGYWVIGQRLVNLAVGRLGRWSDWGRLVGLYVRRIASVCSDLLQFAAIVMPLPDLPAHHIPKVDPREGMDQGGVGVGSPGVVKKKKKKNNLNKKRTPSQAGMAHLGGPD